jgi:erythromycin esterase-like protein
MIVKYIFIIGFLQAFSLCAQENNLPNLKYLNKRIHSIDVDASYQNGNWKPVLKEVKGKRIVLLGESNHGSKEIFQSRNDLIKSLHRELGFDVILFESGIGELIEINSQKEQLTGAEMTYGFFSGWRTNEFIQLMDYVRENKLSISGFDVQRTGSSFHSVLMEELRRLNLDGAKYQNIEKRFSDEKRKLSSRQAVYDSVQYSTNNLIKDYEILQSVIEKSEEEVSGEVSKLVVRTIQNRIKYLQYFLAFVKDKDWNKRWKERDFMMFSNLDWLLKTIYKDKKVIVVAHNFHISRFNEKEEVMGEFLKEDYGDDMYAVGVFAGKGSFNNNSGVRENMEPVSDEGTDIKQIINRLNHRVAFLDIPDKEKKGLEWLFRKIIINDTFIDLSNSNELILSKSFDGLLFIDEISPSEKD